MGLFTDPNDGGGGGKPRPLLQSPNEVSGVRKQVMQQMKAAISRMPLRFSASTIQEGLFHDLVELVGLGKRPFT